MGTAGISFAETFPYPTFTEKREFTVIAHREVVRVKTKFPLSVLIFKSAFESCSLNLPEVQKRFDDIANADGILFSSLSNLFPDPQIALSNRMPKNLVIAVDDFAKRRGVFNSFFLNEVVDANGSRHSMIVLDCTQMARGYWLPSLAHELTHALFAYNKETHHGGEIDSWFEEGLSELMEVDAGGMQPVMDIHALAQMPPDRLPSLLEMQRPLSSKENYALSYLFANYLYYRWGGWETLRVMAGLDTSSAESSCLSRKDFLDRSSCLAQSHYFSRSDSPALAEKMTRNGLLRYFAVALTLNLSSFPMYSIPGWSGWADFSSMSQTLISTSLASGQIQTLPDSEETLAYLRTVFLSQPSDSLEAYQISNSGEHFTIVALNPLDTSDSNSVQQTSFNSSEKRFILLINLGQH
ncbi:MAG: hypothetical protein ACXWRU_19100 [Pseudobdellovibrionaceae bacterium]